MVSYVIKYRQDNKESEIIFPNENEYVMWFRKNKGKLHISKVIEKYNG